MLPFAVSAAGLKRDEPAKAGSFSGKILEGTGRGKVLIKVLPKVLPKVLERYVALPCVTDCHRPVNKTRTFDATARVWPNIAAP